MAEVTDRLSAAFGDRYRILRLLGEGGVVVVENFFEELRAKLKK